MIIRELHLIHFGKFHNYVIELGPHMNLLSGPNEAGKTTVFAFIYGMFFGLKRSRGRAAAMDMYTRFLPWDSPGSYEGLMLFEHGGKNYRIYRNFHKNSPSVSLICLDNQKEILLPHGVIGDLIPELTEENYRNTFGVAQAHSEVDGEFALELQSQAANMAMTGSQNLHLGRALDYLKRERQRVKGVSAAGQLQALNEQIHHLKQEQEKYSKTGKALDSHINNNREKELLSLTNQTKAAMEKCQLDLGMGLGEQRRLQADLEHLENAKEAKAGKAGSAPGSRHARGSGMRCTGASGAGRRLPLFGAAGLSLGIIIGLAAIGNASKMPAPFLFGCLVLCLLLLAVGISGCIFMFREPFKDSSVKEETGQEEEIVKGYEYQKRLLLEKLNQSREHVQALKEEMQRLKVKLLQLSEEEEQYRQTLSRQSWEQEKFNEIQNTIEDCMEEARRLSENEALMKKECDCIDIASRMIGELAKEIHEGFGSRLWETAAALMEEITGTGRRFRLGQDLKISIDNSKSYVPAKRLSRGTMEQLYLSLRLGAARLLFGENEIPLILDDTFAYYDDERLRALLSWLGASMQGQVLLFSCHRREGILMDERNIDYNYVNLDGAFKPLM